MGKSSLMNMIGNNLEAFGFRIVRFNAWHHQNEKNLLAALLENIRLQAIPHLFAPGGLLFRVRLFLIRTRRAWLWTLVLTLLASFWAGYLWSDPDRMNALWHTVSTDGTFVVERVMSTLSSDPKGPAATPAPGPVTNDMVAEIMPSQPVTHRSPAALLFLSLLLGVYKLRDLLQAFGVKPSALMATASGKFSIKTFEAEIGFRKHFSDEFADVTQALSPRTMVILIDDLDRCHPEHVLEILEALNFLSSCGECFLILGMAMDKVERCVAWSFRNVAGDLVDPGEEDGPETARDRRLTLAREYLEKLINIQVPVPQPDEARYRRLLHGEEDHTSAGASTGTFKLFLRGLTRLERYQGLIRRWSLVPFIFLLFASGFYHSGRLFSPDPMVVGSQRLPAVTTPDASGTPSTASDVTEPSKRNDRERPEVQAGGFTSFATAESDSVSTWWLYGTLLALVLLGIWRLALLAGVVIRDSPMFKHALTVWQPLVTLKRTTPRALKQFLNLVRYHAMFQGDHQDHPSMWQKLFSQERQGPGVIIPESILVALTALEICCPESFQHIPDHDDDQAFLASLEPPIAALCGEALNQSRVSFEELKKYLPHFKDRTPGIRFT